MGHVTSLEIILKRKRCMSKSLPLDSGKRSSRFSHRMIAACKFLRHFSLDNCFSNPWERFDRGIFLSRVAEPWHTITHLTISASDRSIAFTTDLLAAGTITHFTFRQASTFWEAYPSDRSLLKLRHAMCANAHRFVELKFSHDTNNSWGDDYEGFDAYLEPVIHLLTSCERLLLLSDHVNALSSLHLPHLTQKQHITIMGLAFANDSGDLQQLAEFVIQHVDTLKTVRTTPYHDSHSKWKYSKVDANNRLKVLDLCIWCIENCIKIELDNYRGGGIGVHTWPQDEDMYLGEFEHGADNFNKYYFNGYQYD